MGNFRVRYVMEFDVVAQDKYEAEQIAREYLYNDEFGYSDDIVEYGDAGLPGDWWARNSDAGLYTVWVGGAEFNDHAVSLLGATSIANELRDEGYDDVVISHFRHQ
jgi:hypothetical protein